MSDKKHVVIIGGGLAGLSAAECLLRHPSRGFDVTILEAKRITGGRAGSFQDSRSDTSIDYCQHVAMGCCTNLIGLLERNELMQHMRRYRELEFLHPEFPPSRFAPIQWLPAPLHLAQTIGDLKYLTWAQQRGIRRALLRLMRTKPSELTSMTAHEWLHKQRQDRVAIERFWDVILVSALGESTSRVSMSAARKVLVDGFASAKQASDVLVPNLPLSRLIGEKLTASIEALGAEVLRGHPVQKVLPEPIGVSTREGETRHCDHIISAVPWHRLGELLDSQSQEAIQNFAAIQQIPSSPITGIHLWFDRPISEIPHHVFVDTTIQWLFRDPVDSTEASTINTDRREFYYQVVISASHDARSLPKDQLVDQIRSELRRAFPSTASARLIRSQVVTDPRSVFSVTPQVEAIRPPARTALPWFHLAGDWTATGWPATMEGAVISGIQAACSVFESDGIPTVQVDRGLQRGWLAKLLIAD